jgi:hypothetical protein
VQLDDHELVGFMIRYLYGLWYCAPAVSTTSNKSRPAGRRIPIMEDRPSEPSTRTDVVAHAQMCVMADYYDIPTLRTFAKQQLEIASANEWNSPGFITVLNLLCNPPLETDESFQQIVLKTITQHPSLLDKPGIESILLDKPSLSLALLKKFRESLIPESW